jgi:demethylmenaquinone methyltransferase/2-methoxy-6-polyprenyl-1,4-benzoquinol methylase
MRAGNAVWFRNVVPMLGRLLAHDEDAYRYLPQSTAYLPSHDNLAMALARADFYDTRVDTFTGGSVLLLTGTRA